VDRSIEEAFEPYRMTFKELKENKKQLPSQFFCKEKKKHEENKYFLERQSIIRGFLLFAGGLGT
jgi:hypothetical protein